MKKLYIVLALVATAANAQTVSFTGQVFGPASFNPCVVDMDGDYLDDIVTIQANQLTIYRQQASGGFVTSVVPVTGLGVGNVTPDWSISAADFDRNGFTDLCFGNGSRVSVIKANDAGTGYTVVTYPQYIFSQRTNFIDIDNDGNLDLFACHDVDMSHTYRNDGYGNLVFDQTLMPTLDVGGNYASAWSDVDNDGDQDMYLAKCRGGAPVGDPQRINLLYKNNGDGTYTESGAAAGVNDGFQSWSSAFADYDNDGYMDFVVSNVSDQNRLYRNNGDGTFTDVLPASGILPQVGSWEIQSGDFNNDGWVDFLWENGKELYINNGNMTFTGQDLPFGQGGIADLNNDGFLDVQSGNMVYYNNGNPNKWLKVRLQGIQSNRNGIGARVEIHGSWGKQIREVRSGEGFSNMSSMNLHFGIGTATSITKVVVIWPSGIIDEIVDPSSNQSLFVLEGSSPALSVNENAQQAFTLYPNPAHDRLRFEGALTVKSALVYDLSGKLVLSGTVDQNSLDIRKLPSGTYVLLLQDADGVKHTNRFIKQ